MPVDDLATGIGLGFWVETQMAMRCAPLCCAGMEEDGYDETILPTDYKRAGQIRDTELAQVLVHGLPRGVTLHALFDSCHSGAGLEARGWRLMTPEWMVLSATECVLDSTDAFAGVDMHAGAGKV